MNLITGASTFATIVSLIGQFRAETSSKDQTDFNSFLTWLVETQHHELKKLLEANAKSEIGIKVLLNENQDVLVKKLESLDRALASFASCIDGFSDIVFSIKPEAYLSQQAIYVLQQFEASGASKALEHRFPMRGIELVFLDGKHGQIEITEQRFIEDDMKTLVELGLLRHEYNSKGSNLYIFTRLASQLIN